MTDQPTREVSCICGHPIDNHDFYGNDWCYLCDCEKPEPLLSRVEWEAIVGSCPGNDPTCPGHDHGDPCNYREDA